MTKPDHLTYQQVADLLQCSVRTVYRFHAAGLLQHVTPGVFDATTAKQLAEQRQQQRTATTTALSQRHQMLTTGQWLTFHDAARELRVKPATVRDLVRTGRLTRPAHGVITAHSLTVELERRAEKHRTTQEHKQRATEMIATKLWMTYKEAAADLKVLPSTVRRWTSTGELDRVAPNLVTAASVQALQAQRTTQ